MPFNNISFILHQPQLSENIGACARAIKNFNFNDKNIKSEIVISAIPGVAGLNPTINIIGKTKKILINV